MRRPELWLDLFDVEVIPLKSLCRHSAAFRKQNITHGGFGLICVTIRLSWFARIPHRIVKHRWTRIACIALVVAALTPMPLNSQAIQPLQPSGPYARIAIMRALDGHGVEWEAGYIRHLEWHRQAHDPFAWYSYSVWASDEHQRWIIYATFGRTSAELSNPVSPAEDERDNLINVLPPAQFMGNGIYEFLPSLSRGNGVPTPSLVPNTQPWNSTRELAKLSRPRLLRNRRSWNERHSGID